MCEGEVVVVGLNLNDIRWENCHNFISQLGHLLGSVETFPLSWCN